MAKKKWWVIFVWFCFLKKLVENSVQKLDSTAVKDLKPIPG